MTDTPAPTPTEVLAAHIDQRNAWLTTIFQKPSETAVYLETLQARANAFAAHVADMWITPEMAERFRQMAEKYGPWVRAHYFITDWPTALLIIRYGEEPDAEKSSDMRTDESGIRLFKGWPRIFSEADQRRAQEMLSGHNWPRDLTLLAPDAGLTTDEVK